MREGLCSTSPSVSIDRTNVYRKERAVKCGVRRISEKNRRVREEMVYVLPPHPLFVGGFVVVAAAPDVIRSAVLIFSEDPLAAALIGAAAELVGFEPAFPIDGEPPRETLLRLRPRVVLVDCDHDAACAPSFFGPALMTGARVLLVASPRTRRDASGIAARFGLRAITMPADVATIAELLRSELEAAGR